MQRWVWPELFGAEGRSDLQMRKTGLRGVASFIKRIIGL